MSDVNPLQVLSDLSCALQFLEERCAHQEHEVRQAVDRETRECAELVGAYLAASCLSGARYDIPLALLARLEERRLTGPICPPPSLDPRPGLG